MNRQIKFRAWDKSCNKMRGIKGLQDCFSLRSDGVSNDDYILMQFTSLKDINGKEIYEGDIVNIRHYGSQKKVIVEIDEDGVFPFGYKYSEWDGYYLQTAEVIGNIYENPELLKDK